jgi:DNA-binding NarL/FixJ family response regulator
VDISLKDFSGIELIKELRKTCPSLSVLVLSMCEELHYAERALRARAKSCIMKSEGARKVIEGIRSVNHVQVLVGEKIAARMAGNFVAGRTEADSTVSQLSDREREVFQLLSRGRSTQQIVDRLNVAFKTVHTYCARIKEKLNLDNATGLLREAIRWHENQQ